MDILRWNAEAKLVSFTVMGRPLRWLQKLVELMAVQLAAGPARDMMQLTFKYMLYLNS